MSEKETSPVDGIRERTLSHSSAIRRVGKELTII